MTIFLENDTIRLRTIERDDLKALTQLMSDRETALFSGEVYPITEKGMEDFYERTQKTEDRIWLLIESKASNEIIGETGFLRIFMPWRTADYSLMIWKKEFWGKGIAKMTADLMLEYGFNFLNFHRVAIGVVEKNERAVRFWKKLGFVEEGRQVHGFFSHGEYSDFVMMRMLEDEYRKR
jgi:RimJ/RimL family protein N-acetyltransferase